MPEMRFASPDQIRQAYILSSPDGETAAAAALDIAGAAVCRGAPPLPCRSCAACRKVAAGTHPDVRVIARLEENGKKKREILVSQIREISADAAVLPNEAPRKVYLIREADTMNEEAQNAALKLLEEPPNACIFLLCTENPERLLSTVRSRCVELSFSSADTASSPESAALAEEYLKKVSEGDLFALWQFCEDSNSISIQEMTEFCLCTAQRITDMLCGRADALGMSASRLFALERLMEQCIRYLKVNVNVKQVFGLLEAASIPS